MNDEFSLISSRVNHKILTSAKLSTIMNFHLKNSSFFIIHHLEFIIYLPFLELYSAIEEVHHRRNNQANGKVGYRNDNHDLNSPTCLIECG